MTREEVAEALAPIEKLLGRHAAGSPALDDDTAQAIRLVAQARRAYGLMLGALTDALEDHELHCSGDQSSRGCGLRDRMRAAIAAAKETP